MNKRAYHHGDLANAAVVCGYARQAQITDGSLVGLREVAAELGVSHTAVSRHFAGKVGFLSAVAVRAYREIAALLSSASRRQRKRGVVAELRGMGLAYQQYHFRQPGVLPLLQHPQIVSHCAPAFLAEYNAMLSVLFEVIERGKADKTLINRQTSDIAYVLLSFSLGYSESNLAQRPFDGSVPVRDDGWAITARHFKSVYNLVLRGLMAQPGLAGE